MAVQKVESIRNVALVGHSGAGKTTLVEALLHQAGALKHQGTVEAGNTVCDYDPLEKSSVCSLMSAIATFEHDGVEVNMIDTPGSGDFLGHALSSLAGVGTAMVVVDARTGIQMNTNRLMRRSLERGLARVLVVNKIDSDEIDLPELVESLRTTYGSECLPINLPANGGREVIDCFFKAGGDADFSSVQEAHKAIVEQVVEVDEVLMEAYLEKGDDLTPAQLHAPFERALREGHLIPICFVSAKSGAGLKELSDIIIKMLPNPSETNLAPFVKGKGDAAEDVTMPPDPTAKAIAHVFKVTTDPYVGKLSVFRVHRGTIAKDSHLHIDGSKKAVRIAHLFKLQGKDHVEIDKAVPGEICAVAKIEDIKIGSILHEDGDDADISMRPVYLPTPMFGLAITPKVHGEEDKLGNALSKLKAEDPCFHVEHTPSGETVVRGLGDQHLRIMLTWMKDRYHVEVDTKPPTIPYRETIKGKAEGHHRHKKQTGGAGQFGEVYLRVEPTERGEGFEFVSAVVGGSIPAGLIAATEKGVRMAYETGVMSGNPMQDIRVTVYDGKTHAVDSKEIAFISAGKKAFQEAVNKASPVILEPIVDISVTAPDSDIGTVTGDLAGLRGQISGTEAGSGGNMIVTAKVPLAELTDFHSRLKSVTSGKGMYSFEFSHYGQVPGTLQKELIESFKPHPEDD